MRIRDDDSNPFSNKKRNFERSAFNVSKRTQQSSLEYTYVKLDVLDVQFNLDLRLRS